MICVSPITITNDKGRFTVPCGRCPMCIKNRQEDWIFRLNEEFSVSSSALFLTLTYSDEHIPVGENNFTLFKRDLQNFHKRLRINHDRHEKVQKMAKNWPKIKYYAIGEYGSKTERPHYHGIYFNIWPELEKELVTIWGKGHVKIGTVTPQSIAYVTSYLFSKLEKWEGKEQPFALISKKMGADYVKKNFKFHNTAQQKRAYVISHDRQIRMPKYYKEKIFNDYDRFFLAKQAVKMADDFTTKLEEKAIKQGDDPRLYLAKLRYEAYRTLAKKQTKNKTQL